MSIVTSGTRHTDEVATNLQSSDSLYEEVDGRRVELPPMGSYAEVLATRLAYLLYGLVDGQDLGLLTAETLFVLDSASGLKRRPDIAFVSYGRWPKDKPVPHKGTWEVVPDIAVEVISPNDFDLEVAAKLREYFRYGVRQVWQVRPSEGLVYVYDSPTSVTIHERTETIDCGPILGNVRLALDSVFQGAGG